MGARSGAAARPERVRSAARRLESQVPLEGQASEAVAAASRPLYPILRAHRAKEVLGEEARVAPDAQVDGRHRVRPELEVLAPLRREAALHEPAAPHLPRTEQPHVGLGRGAVAQEIFGGEPARTEHVHGEHARAGGGGAAVRVDFLGEERSAALHQLDELGGRGAARHLLRV